MVAAAQQPDPKREPNPRHLILSSLNRLAFMDYRCSIYGLGIVTNRIIPGVPASTIASEDLRISFGSLPAWHRELTAAQGEVCYVADYKSECGAPALRVFRLLDGKY